MTRRTFCEGLALTALTFTTPASLLAAATGAATRERRFLLCLNPGAIGVQADQEQAIDLAGRYGFEAVEPMSGTLARLSPPQLNELTASLRSKHLQWGSAGLPVNFRGSDTQFTTDLRALASSAPALQRAGVTRVNTWLSPGSNELTYTRNFAQHAHRLRETARLLADHGLRLGLEYVGTHTSLIARKYPFIHTLAETRDLIAAIGTGNVGLVLDSWHWWQAGDSESDLLTLTNEEIVAVDLNDAPAGIPHRQQKDGQRELPAATGVIAIRPFLQALVQVGYDGPVRAEPFNQPLRELDNDAACQATIDSMRAALRTAGLE